MPKLLNNLTVGIWVVSLLLLFRRDWYNIYMNVLLFIMGYKLLTYNSYTLIVGFVYLIIYGFILRFIKLPNNII